MNDVEIYKNLYKILSTNKVKVRHIINILNIYFVFKKIRKGCLISLYITKNRSNKLDILLDNLKLYYKKYYIVSENTKYYLYCISNTIIKKELFEYFINKDGKYRSIQRNLSVSSEEVGKFLGYECPGDVDNRNHRNKVYVFKTIYKNNEIYSYICKELDINKVIKQLKLVNRMNGLLRKYLSKKLDGKIVLEISLQ
jgi:hypothetical protein